MPRAFSRASASFDRLPIRVRLAGVSALLTFVILCAFAVAMGSFTVHRIRADFNRQVTDTANQLPTQLNIKVAPASARNAVTISPPLSAYAAPADHAVVRVFTLGGRIVAQEPANAPSLGTPSAAPKTVHGYRVVSRPGIVRASSETSSSASDWGTPREGSRVRAIASAVEVSSAIGAIARRAIAIPASSASPLPASTPNSRNSSTRAMVASVSDIWRPYWMITCPTGSSLPAARTIPGRLTTR